jgi:hypothetical protein
MLFEDVSLYLDPSLGCSESGSTLAGVAVVGIFDSSAEITQGEAITLAPTFLLASSTAPSAAEGQTLIRSAISYKVRQVLREPPDGALTRLVLARV